VVRHRPGGGAFALVTRIADGTYLGNPGIDLSGISTIDLRAMVSAPTLVELRLDAPNGQKVGKLRFDPQAGGKFQTLSMPVSPAQVTHAL
jgi:hypothetical protein